ncbi:unnamed protein product [Symbiodinium pilosum]|uniref:Uncharacterized protein n=1 Tax=Symbiodinium pilosum TaxID=2952 RepID=A0A812QVP9_SYMPI|nr:unnamed protein product [Symbiodinium pilosum]
MEAEGKCSESDISEEDAMEMVMEEAEVGESTSESESSEVLALEDAVQELEGPATSDEPTSKSKRRWGRTGLRGVSKRIDTRSRTTSYQAAVCFDNLTLRSKYCSDIQQAVDFHIIFLQIRDEVERTVAGQPGLAWSEACKKACETRDEELKAMKVAFYVDMRAFGVKLSSPSTSSLPEALEYRERLFAAREANEEAFGEELVNILLAHRQTVNKRRPAKSQEEAMQFSQSFLTQARERKEAIEKLKLLKQEQRQKAAAAREQKRLRRQEQRHSQLASLWKPAAKRAELRLQRTLARARCKESPRADGPQAATGAAKSRSSETRPTSTSAPPASPVGELAEGDDLCPAAGVVCRI